MKRTYVIAALGVFAAVAIAAPGFGVSGSIKKAIKKEVSKQIAKKKGPTGPTGPAGPAGGAGAAGAAGGVLSGQATAIPGTGAQYLVPSGKAGPGVNPDDAATLSPNTPTVAGDLAVRLRTPVDNVAGHKRNFELYAGVGAFNATGVACDVTAVVDGGDGVTCHSTTTAPIAPGSLMIIIETGTGNPPISDATFGLSLTP
jgi:hypothetical protein